MREQGVIKRFLEAVCAGMVLMSLNIAACGSPKVEAPSTRVQSCNVQFAEAQNDGTTSIAGEAGYQMVANVAASWNAETKRYIKSGFDSLQRDYDLATAKLCSDLEEKRITQEDYRVRRDCMDRSLQSMRHIRTLLESDAVKNNPQYVGWILENQFSAIEQNFECGKVARFEEGRGVKRVSNLTLEGATKPLGLEASIICQRRNKDGYENIELCQGAKMRENDRFKISFAASDSARLYIFLYNDKGQFQMLFPDQGIDNALEGTRRYTLPAGDDWFELDDVSGVVEYLHVVIAPSKIRELEAYRGLDIPPGEQRKVALQARGRLEPILSRGVKPKKQALKLEDTRTQDSVSATILNVQSQDGVSAVEFRIHHVK